MSKNFLKKNFKVNKDTNKKDKMQIFFQKNEFFFNVFISVFKFIKIIHYVRELS
jgi:hypothetical protein